MPIETLTDSSVNIGGKGDPQISRSKLESVRAARIVVATAGAFEKATHEVNSFRVFVAPLRLRGHFSHIGSPAVRRDTRVV